MKRFITSIALTALVLPHGLAAQAFAFDFVTVRDGRLMVASCPHYFTGVNFWQGMNLASDGSGGNRIRLGEELDRLQQLGITNVRVMAGSEGPNTEPWRMVPALQTSPGVYDPEVLDGLDYLLKAMDDRGLRVVMCLTNFWPWSGGMAQYRNWNGAGPIPYPPPEPGGDWNTYAFYTNLFYSDPPAMQDFRDFVLFLINHVNPYTSLAYKDDPTIMAWELANEPRGYDNVADFNAWIDDTAAYIKSLDSNHLVTTGCEGDTPWPDWNGLDFVANHDGPDIDYATVHIWPQNWGWYDPENPATYATAEANARGYFQQHTTDASGLGKPLVLEEFGLSRDWEPLHDIYDPNSPTTLRDLFYAAMFEEIFASASTGGPAGGDNIWVWSGQARPGDEWTGDPPHETPGWYSVYDTDESTLAIISAHADEMESVHPAPATDFDGDCDVDADDHALFEACASGPAVPLDPGCEDKDFDNDNDVDQSDFGIFQRCLSGEDVPADPTCAD